MINKNQKIAAHPAKTTGDHFFSCLQKELLSKCITSLTSTLNNRQQDKTREESLPLLYEVITTKKGLKKKVKTITWGYGETPFGRCFIATTEKGILELQFTDVDITDVILLKEIMKRPVEKSTQFPGGTAGPEDTTGAAAKSPHYQGVPETGTDYPSRLSEEFPDAMIVRDQSLTEKIIHLVFDTKKPHLKAPLRLMLCGTQFQVHVWKTLLRIPRGCVTSYARIAGLIGTPGACRAVGTAIAHNRIAYIIPCHRVIKKNGETGGYRWV